MKGGTHVTTQTSIVQIRFNLKLGASICIMANSALKMVHASSAKAVPIEADRKPSEDASSVSASDSTEPLSLPNRILEEPRTPANETDLGIWWDSDSDSEVSSDAHHGRVSYCYE